MESINVKVDDSDVPLAPYIGNGDAFSLPSKENSDASSKSVVLLESD